MKYLLDTNICIYLIRNRPAEVRKKFISYAVGDIGISSITVAELWVGVEKNQQRDQAAFALEQFLQALNIADFDVQAAVLYGKIRAQLEKQGTPIGPFDILIAAHAIRLDATLITNNVRKFARVSGLKVENWVNS
ncbi:type II toxin-antitoxin system VapC family toxin [soil metagenome]